MQINADDSIPYSSLKDLQGQSNVGWFASSNLSNIVVTKLHYKPNNIVVTKHKSQTLQRSIV